jgi:hypothetical protein
MTVEEHIDALPEGPREIVRFKRLEDIDLDVVSELCRRAADLVAADRFAM